MSGFISEIELISLSLSATMVDLTVSKAVDDRTKRGI